MMAHPFWASSREEAAAMEQQALGRINRIGQQASSLMLWRVVTEDTIEAQLYRPAPPERKRRRGDL